MIALWLSVCKVTITVVKVWDQGHLNHHAPLFPLPLDMTRQYKTMQTQLESRIQFLEAQVRRLQSELGKHSLTNSNTMTNAYQPRKGIKTWNKVRYTIALHYVQMRLLFASLTYTHSGSKLNTTSQLIENASPSDSTQQMLQCVTAERDRLQKEKEEEVATLNGKLHAMEKSYEAVLQVCGVW